MKGFTLIELLVVIAIIGILSAVVLASLSTARNRAGDARVQEQLSSMRSAAEMYFGSHGNSYGTASACNTANSMFVDNTTGMSGLLNGLGAHCGANGSAWAVGAKFVTDANQWWCVDSSGDSKRYSTTVANNVTTNAFIADNAFACP